MDVNKLKKVIQDVMPILDVNLHAAYTEYMRGDIPAGAFGYVRRRHENALVVLQRDDIEPKSAFLACAMLASDLRSGLADVENKIEAQESIEAWWQCYRDAGFTATHKFFDCPALPE